MQDIYRTNTLESGAGNLTRKYIGEMLRSPNVAVVLDFDHTIADTSDFHNRSFGKALKDVGRSFEITPDFAEKKLRGKSDGEILSILLEVSGGVDEDLLLRAVRVRKKYLEELLLGEDDLFSYLIDGIPALVRYFRNHQKKIGIASASPDKFVRGFISRSFVDGISIADVVIPEAIVGGTTVRNIHKALLSSGENTPSLDKPNPFSITLSASRVDGHGNDNRPILYVGDGKVDALSVKGRNNMVGLIVNVKDRDALSGEFAGYNNIAVVGSVLEVLNNE